jgi:hypothetical protein
MTSAAATKVFVVDTCFAGLSGDARDLFGACHPNSNLNNPSYKRLFLPSVKAYHDSCVRWEEHRVPWIAQAFHTGVRVVYSNGCFYDSKGRSITVPLEVRMTIPNLTLYGELVSTKTVGGGGGEDAWNAVGHGANWASTTFYVHDVLDFPASNLSARMLNIPTIKGRTIIKDAPVAYVRKDTDVEFAATMAKQHGCKFLVLRDGDSLFETGTGYVIKL